jgi:hypothetical protein
MAGFINVNAAIEEADRALTEKAEVRDRVAALRELLRSAVTARETTAEQAEWIGEAFPLRERKVKTDDGETVVMDEDEDEDEG